MTTPDIKLSNSMQDVAAMLDNVLAKLAGERCSFVLLAVPQDSVDVQHIGNLSHENTAKLVRSFLERLGNPAVKSDLAEHQKAEAIDRLVTIVRLQDELLASFATQVFDLFPSDPAVAERRQRFEKAQQSVRGVLADIEARRAFAREVNANGTIDAPPQAERH